MEDVFQPNARARDDSIEDTRLEPPRQPGPAAKHRIDIKIGYLCNNMCDFCVQGDKRRKRRDMAGDKVLQTLKTNSGKSEGVVFTGGEPTMRRELPQWTAAARDLGYSVVQIQTNGRAFASKTYCKEMIAAGATEFAIALHGHNSDTHDYLTKAPGSFQQTARGILNLKAEGARILTNTVITRSNYRNLPQIARLLLKLGADQFQFAFVHAVGSARANFHSVVPRKTLVEPYVKEGLSIGISANTRVMAEAIPFCFMQGFENCVAEAVIPPTKIYEGDNVIEDFAEFRTRKGKSHGPQCRKCARRKLCEGPWREYPAVYGWDEFIPL